jgi:hypothetical protein
MGGEGTGPLVAAAGGAVCRHVVAARRLLPHVTLQSHVPSPRVPCPVSHTLPPPPDLPVEDLEEYLTALRQTLVHAGVDTAASPGPSVLDEREEKLDVRQRNAARRPPSSVPSVLDDSDDDADSFSSTWATCEMSCVCGVGYQSP